MTMSAGPSQPSDLAFTAVARAMSSHPRRQYRLMGWRLYSLRGPGDAFGLLNIREYGGAEAPPQVSPRVVLE